MKQKITQQTKQLNVLIVQNNPKILQKTVNIQKCRQMLKDKKQWTGLQEFNEVGSVDLVMFPEMAFTGYNFQHYDHVLPAACFADQGEDFDFAREVCKMFDAYVLFGYVEKVSVQKSNDSKQEYELFNSAAMLDPSGKLILNTRKSHLYFCDELWSKEGDGFKVIDIKTKNAQSLKCAVGICMDINQKNFISGKFQLAEFIINSDAECLLFVSNWTDTSPSTNEHRELYRMLNYWLYRLSPLIKENQRKRLFFISDRVGCEYNFYDKKQSWFFGCSGGLIINPPQVIDILDKRKQGCIFISGSICPPKK